ncbi:MarR family winged helix-turn-helix transcriptional regulator [Streptomyces monticola]|uniref:MarR family winged helix-turn-helix transcriptional regulator n=1 Tax=Streptomyces monticola TaxID=2666263 RepID=A0ABW2JJ16_9ACTN
MTTSPATPAAPSTAPQSIYTHSDEELVKQPIGYWSWAAHKAVVDYIRAGLTEVGLSQPQWWVLNQLRDGERDRTEVFTMLSGYLDVGAALNPDIDELLDRGLISSDADEHLTLTAEGTELLGRATDRQVKSLAQVHDGISDAEFLTTMKVLQRMIHNTGGKAWHH